MMTLDDRDRRILSALAENAWLSYVELGARLHLSPSAVQRRVEKLVATGAILGAHARVAPKAFGRPLRLYVLVDLNDESKATIDGFVKRLRSCADLVDAHYVAGAADIVLTLQTPDLECFTAFADEFLNGNPQVRRYKTLTSLRALI